MATLSTYLQTCINRLKFSYAKTVTAAFYLNNREDKREQKVYNNNRLLPFCQPYLSRSKTGQKTYVPSPYSSRVTLLRQLAGSEWGAGAKTLRTTALSIDISQQLSTVHQSAVAALTLAL